MNNDKVTTTIAADYMYLVFLGDEDIITQLINKLNSDVEESIKLYKATKNYKSSKMQPKNIYIKHDICTPCVDILEYEQIQKIINDEVIERIRRNRSNNSNVITKNDIDIHRKYIIPDEGVESAQCWTYAEILNNDSILLSKKKGLSKNLYMIMVMTETDTHFKLRFPILELDEEENPDKLISKWLQQHKIDHIVKELTIRPVKIVGNEHEILVFVACINE